MKKVAILGGSFDPIHNGHIEIAKAAKDHLHVDEVWFLLSEATPLKARQLTSYHHRYQMLKRALCQYKKFHICTIEKDSDGVNYTVDTMRRLKRKYPNVVFSFLLGADQVEKLSAWKDIQGLLKLTNLCVVARKGYSLKSDYPLTCIEMREVDISSSEIRMGMLREIHPKVKQYMMEEMLYPEMLKQWMSEYRYLHTLEVAKLAKTLAKQHGLNEKCAYQAGLYHDINKEFKLMSMEESQIILEKLYPAYMEMDSGIWHGVMARYICKHVFNMRDKRVLQAIEHHVLGNGRGVYDQLLYVSDKLEPTRKYETESLLKISQRNLHEGYIEVKNEVNKRFKRE